MNIYSLMAPCFWDVYDDIKAGRHGEYRLKGGRGSGKSSFAALVLIRGILSDPDANAIVYRRVAATLRDSVHSKLCWAVSALGLEEFFRIRKTPLEIEYIPTGQKILFRGADDPLKSKSIALKNGYFRYLWFEELAEFRCEADIRSITQSVLRGGMGQIICTYNPPASPRHWVNESALVPKPGVYIHSSTYLDMPPEFLGSRFIAEAEALKRANPRIYASEYLGEVTGTGGNVFSNVVLRQISDAEIRGFEHVYCGLDFGFARDPDAFVRCALDRRNSALYIFDEYVGEHDSAARLCSEVLSRAEGEYVFCDSAEPRMINELKRGGIKAVSVKKGPGSRDHSYKQLETLAKIIIDPARAPVAAREWSSLEYPRDRGGEYIRVYPDGDDHTIDAVRYALEREFAHKTARTVKL